MPSAAMLSTDSVSGPNSTGAEALYEACRQRKLMMKAAVIVTSRPMCMRRPRQPAARVKCMPPGCGTLLPNLARSQCPATV